MRFVHDTLPQRVAFGSGAAAANLSSEIGNLGAARVMLIASKTEMHLADTIAKDIPVALRHDDVVMHVPVEVAERARDAATSNGIDVLVSVGGGSTTGLAKAIAMTTGLPIIAVPTTYAGSEATPVWGLTEGAKKTTGIDQKVLPKVIIYDAALTMSLPVEMSVASGPERARALRGLDVGAERRPDQRRPRRRGHQVAGGRPAQGGRGPDGPRRP